MPFKQRKFSNGSKILCVLALFSLTASLTPAAHAAPNATYVVNTLNDNTTHSDGFCTLREAIEAANSSNSDCGSSGSGNDLITFSVSGTIVLGSTLLDYSWLFGSLTIDGTGQNITISGNNLNRVFLVDSATNVTLKNLTIANGKNSSGGGVYNNGGTLSVIGSTFSGNTAIGIGGGGIYNFGGNLTVTNSSFSSNGTNTGDGGGISNSGNVTVTNSAFSGNYAFTGNGGGISNIGILTVTNSTFSSNSALGPGTSVGGGINNTGTLSMTNSTFYLNSASSGSPSAGGGINNSGTVTTTNSTFSDNTASTAGGINSSAGTVTLRNTIVANSTGGNCGGTITNGGGNLSYSDATCPGVNSDPKLGSLASNGGATQTMALLPGSAAINAAVDGNCPATDQRGWHRYFGTHCDIGAYERGAFLYLPLIMR